MSIPSSLGALKELRTERWLLVAGLSCAGCGSSSFADAQAGESQGIQLAPPPPGPPVPWPNCALIASVRHGNVKVLGAAQARAYQCISEIDGDLTVEGGNVPDSGAYAAGLSVAMPNLRRVTGNLTINSDHASSIAFDSLAEVGGKLNVSITRFVGVSHPPGGGAPTFATVFTSLSAPVLSLVGGDVELHAHTDPGIGGFSATYEFGLDALVAVGGSVLVDQPLIPGTPRGLRNLVSVPGNVVIYQPLADFVDNSLLTQLDSIGGDLKVTTNPFFRYLMPVLTKVGGQVTLVRPSSGGTIRDAVLPLLRTVGGDVTLTNYALESCTALHSLASVGGTFRIRGGRLNGYYGATSGPAPEFAGIDVGDAAGSLIPFGSGTIVPGAGALSFHDNTELCPCQVNGFAAALTSNGWSGTLVNTGNGSGVACPSTCSASTCP